MLVIYQGIGVKTLGLVRLILGFVSGEKGGVETDYQIKSVIGDHNFKRERAALTMTK